MPRRKPKHTLLSAGASLIGMGLIFLLLPAMLGTRPVMNAVGVNWGQIKISQSALTLRMTQASPTHWYLRLGADAATRQQLSPPRRAPVGNWGQITISTRLLEIARLTPEQQAALLAVAFEGEYWRPELRREDA